MITGIYVNAENYTAAPITVESSLESYYKLLDVDFIDIVSRKIGGKYYDIICDDEALLKADPICSMMEEKTPMLFGNLFICLHDGKGAEISLEQKDITRILRQMKPVLVSRKGKLEYRFILRGEY